MAYILFANRRFSLTSASIYFRPLSQQANYLTASLMNPALNRAICYIEFPAHDLVATKNFYQKAFGWAFEDYGPDYTSFVDGRIAGGFFRADGLPASQPLVVIWADDLEAILRTVEEAGGSIIKPIFSYPSGRRFHFADPTGNELAVCSK